MSKDRVAAIRSLAVPLYNRLVDDGTLMYGARLLSARRPLALVYGNCQADPLRRIITGSTSRYVSLPMPMAHTISARASMAFLRAAEHVSAFIAQPVRENYRDMPVGTMQMASRLRESASVVTFPSVYFRGFHPYMVNVHRTIDTNYEAPYTGYHDLRTVAIVRSTNSFDAAIERYLNFPTSRQREKSIWDSSLAELRRREEGLDAHASSAIVASPKPMFTINHPPNYVLEEIARQLLLRLGINDDVRLTPTEYLSSVIAPCDFDPRLATELARYGARREWVIAGRLVSELEIFKSHVAYYLANEDATRAAVDQHERELVTIDAI